jgi:hypothetical protein
MRQNISLEKRFGVAPGFPCQVRLLSVQFSGGWVHCKVIGLHLPGGVYDFLIYFPLLWYSDFSSGTLTDAEPTPISSHSRRLIKGLIERQLNLVQALNIIKQEAVYVAQDQ